jgi:hypothetical protein
MTMDRAIFGELEQTLTDEGAEAAIERLCATLREKKDYGNLFYALLLKKRHELGVSPLPGDAAQDLPQAAVAPYEEAIRQAGRLVGQLYLDDGDIPRAWVYFRMLGEPEAVAKALETYQFKLRDDTAGEVDDPEADIRQQLIDIAFNQGVHPRKGFDWILENYGICSTITTVTSHHGMPVDIREYCIKGLVRALHDQVRQRLTDEITSHEGQTPATRSIRDLMAGRDWLFGEDCYHVDTSHLSAVVQMSIELQPGAELDLARELCLYGQRLCPRFQYPGYPPFEDQYGDYGIYLDVLAGENTEAGLAHFRAKIDKADPQTEGTLAAEVLVNLYLRLKRPAEALAVARRYLTGKDDGQRSCPNIAELCSLANDYRTLAEVARDQGDAVHFMAGLLATKPDGR